MILECGDLARIFLQLGHYGARVLALEVGLLELVRQVAVLHVDAPGDEAVADGLHAGLVGLERLAGEV